MVLYDKHGDIVKIYLYGSEEQQRYEKILKLLFEADKRYLEKLLNKKQEREEQLNLILDEPDNKIIHKTEKRKP